MNRERKHRQTAAGSHASPPGLAPAAAGLPESRSGEGIWGRPASPARCSVRQWDRRPQPSPRGAGRAGSRPRARSHGRDGARTGKGVRDGGQGRSGVGGLFFHPTLQDEASDRARIGPLGPGVSSSAPPGGCGAAVVPGFVHTRLSLAGWKRGASLSLGDLLHVAASHLFSVLYLSNDFASPCLARTL